MLFTKAEYLGAATLIGTIIGAGIFGLPYVASEIGFWPAVAYLLVLGAVITLMHLIYGEIVLRTKTHHFLAGYAERYFGPNGKRLVLAFVIPGLFSTLLAYSVVGGRFLDILFSGWLAGNAFLYGLIFGVVGITLVLRRIKFIAELELGIVILMIVTVIGIIANAFPVVDFGNFGLARPFDLFLPYGIILFTVAGFEAIPEMREIFEASPDGRHSSYQKAIIVGTILPLVVFILFMAAVFGVTGQATSEDALHGLLGTAVSPLVIKFGAFFGLLAVASSFFVMADNLKKVLWYDLNFKPFLSWLLVLTGTVFLYFLTGQVFIKAIAFAGAVSGGLGGLTMVLIHRRARRLGNRRPEYSFKIPELAAAILIIMYVVGGIYQLWATLHGQ